MGKKILLAEDSLTIQKVFELTFRGTDIALTTVDNGADAVRLASEIGPDLVITDVTLPGKDGFEVAAELRQAEKTKACPVLILCGTLAPFDEEKFRKSGASGVVFKPFESQELLDKIEAAIRSAAPARDEGKKAAKAAPEETWDFSDVIEEVEEEAAKPALAPAPPGAPQRGEELLAGIVSPAPGSGPAVLGEFDVSLEELEGGSAEAAAPAPPLTDIVKSFDEAVDEAAPEEPIPDLPKAPPPDEADIDLHALDELFQDAPQAVTDISTAMESVEEVEGLELDEELSLLGKEEAPSAPQVPGPPLPAGTPPPAPPRAAPAPTPPPAATIAAPAAPPPGPTARPAAGPAAEAARTEVLRAGVLSAGDAAALREVFGARAQEIIARVAAETMEKVLWDVMDRISADVAAKIKEAVEAVAWEVVPATAETLIREEIARLRDQPEKKSS